MRLTRGSRYLAGVLSAYRGSIDGDRRAIRRRSLALRRAKRLPLAALAVIATGLTGAALLHVGTPMGDCCGVIVLGLSVAAAVGAVTWMGER